jgi:3-hydroxyisobutyrate dehydrogenase-like beta-hydroxyacid dehydrogenase
MDTKGPKMVAGDFTTQGKLSQHLKDVRLILSEGDRVGATLPLSALHRELLEGLEAAGLGEADNSAIIRAFGVARR